MLSNVKHVGTHYQDSKLFNFNQYNTTDSSLNPDFWQLIISSSVLW